MPNFDTYEARVAFAFGALKLREGLVDMTQEELATRFNALSPAPSSQPVVGTWLKRGVMPKGIPAMLAWSRTLGCDPGWIYFGPRESAARVEHVGPTIRP